MFFNQEIERRDSRVTDGVEGRRAIAIRFFRLGVETDVVFRVRTEYDARRTWGVRRAVIVVSRKMISVLADKMISVITDKMISVLVDKTISVITDKIISVTCVLSSSTLWENKIAVVQTRPCVGAGIRLLKVSLATQRA